MTQIQEVKAEVPAALLQCPPQPQPPDDSAPAEAFADFMLDLAAAGDDCRAKLGQVKGLVTPK